MIWEIQNILFFKKRTKHDKPVSKMHLFKFSLDLNNYTMMQ